MNSDNVAQTASEMLEKDVQFTAEEEAAEQEAFAKVIQAMGYYRTSCEASLEKKRLDLAKVPDHQTPLTEGLQRRLDFMQNRIIRNQAFLKMLSTGPHLPYSPSSDDPSKKVAVADIDKVKSLLRQFVRDWSNQGQSERDATYTPILGALQLEFSDVPLENRGQIRVLVPGAGLGRLAFDSARLGFSTQGNEFSFYMLLASDFILNQTSQAEEFELYPWIHSFSNHTCTDHVMQRITVPDVVPGNIPPLTDFSMIAGEFIQVYGGSSQKGASFCKSW